MRAFVSFLMLAAAVAADDPAFEIERFDGERFVGRLTGLDATRVEFVDDDGRSRALPVSDLFSVRRIDPNSTPTRLPRDVVMIANGDRLAVTAKAGDEDAVTVDWFGESAEIPLETVRGLIGRLPRNRAAWEDAVAGPSGRKEVAGDRLVLENGDTVVGEFRGLGPDGVTLGVAGAETAIARDRVRRLTFDPTLVDLPDPPERTRIVRLVDGSRLTVESVVLEGETLVLRTTFGPTLRAPRSALSGLRVVNGRTRDLSDSEPVEFEHTPWLDTRWDWRRDRNVVGRPLRTGGREYAKGIGVHARSRLVHALRPGDTSFRATIGLDDTAGRRGSAEFVVRVDGREAYRSPVLRGGDAPVRIEPIDVTGAKRLELFVDFADRGDVLDRANWCDAVVVNGSRE